MLDFPSYLGEYNSLGPPPRMQICSICICGEYETICKRVNSSSGVGVCCILNEEAQKFMTLHGQHATSQTHGISVEYDMSIRLEKSVTDISLITDLCRKLSGTKSADPTARMALHTMETTTSKESFIQLLGPEYQRS